MDILPGGDGVPPEPKWSTIFGRKEDRAAASEYWKAIVSELRSSEKLAVANAHSMKRLVVAYINFDRSAKEVAKLGPVVAAPKTGVPTYNPWWTTMSNADSQASKLEKELCISPHERGSGTRVQKKTKTASPSAKYLKPVAQ